MDATARVLPLVRVEAEAGIPIIPVHLDILYLHAPEEAAVVIEEVAEATVVVVRPSEAAEAMPTDPYPVPAKKPGIDIDCKTRKVSFVPLDE